MHLNSVALFPTQADATRAMLSIASVISRQSLGQENRPVGRQYGI